jgi:hypothetical protein
MWIIEATIPDTGEVRHLRWNDTRLTDKEIAEELIRYKFLCYNNITQRKHTSDTYTCENIRLLK